jgi:hypothetical protein
MNKFKERVDEYNRMLFETKLSRIWQYVEDDKKIFAIISAYRKKNKPEVNETLSNDLENDIKDLDKGYIKVSGGYVETDDTGKSVETHERSFIISDISKESAIRLGKKYEQESVLYKDKTQFSYISTKDVPSYPVGSVIMNFQKSKGRDNMTFAKEMVSQYYSELLYGPHHGRKYAYKPISENKSMKEFRLLEYHPQPLDPGHASAVMGFKSGWIKVM